MSADHEHHQPCTISSTLQHPAPLRTVIPHQSVPLCMIPHIPHTCNVPRNSSSHQTVLHHPAPHHTTQNRSGKFIPLHHYALTSIIPHIPQHHAVYALPSITQAIVAMPRYHMALSTIMCHLAPHCIIPHHPTPPSAGWCCIWWDCTSSVALGGSISSKSRSKSQSTIFKISKFSKIANVKIYTCLWHIFAPALTISDIQKFKF